MTQAGVVPAEAARLLRAHAACDAARASSARFSADNTFERLMCAAASFSLIALRISTARASICGWSGR